MKDAFSVGRVTRRTLLAAVGMSAVVAAVAPKSAAADVPAPVAMYGRGYGGGY